MKSVDGGDSWQYCRPPPGHLVAALPYKYVPDAPRNGYYQPTNIVKHPKTGLFYTMIHAEEYLAQSGGQCVMRTSDPSDPTSWRAWNGSDFTVRFVNPYTAAGSAANPSDHVCAPASVGAIGGMWQSLLWSTYFSKFILVGSLGLPSPSGPHGAAINGTLEVGNWSYEAIWYSLSSDMITWGPRQLIRYISPTADSSHPRFAYSSLLDPSAGANSPTFDTVGRKAKLYFSRLNPLTADPTSGYNTDLVAQNITFL
jgi:hypothetical protein